MQLDTTVRNAIRFPFALKRSLVSIGTRLSNGIFEMRAFFMNPA
jgi:hypothetical protein